MMRRWRERHDDSKERTKMMMIHMKKMVMKRHEKDIAWKVVFSFWKSNHFLTLTFLSPFLVLLPREADILLYYSSCKSCLTQCLNFLSWLLQKLEGVVSRQLVVSLGVSGHLRRHDSSLGHDGWHSSRLSHELLSHMDFYTLDVIYLWMYCLESLFWNKFTTDLLFWRDSHHRLRSHPQSHSLCLESSWLQ